MSKEFADVHSLIAATAQHYSYVPPPPFFANVQQAITRILHALLDLIASLLAVIPGYTDTRMAGNIMRLGLYAVGLVSALLLIWLLWSRLTELAKQADLARAEAISSEGSFSSKDWYRQAQELSQAQCWRDACRALLLSSIRLLDENQILSFVPTRTNFEYWYALAAHEKIRPCFRSIAETVDFCWFGNKEADEGDFRKCLAYLATIQSEVDGLTSLRTSKESTIQNLK